MWVCHAIHILKVLQRTRKRGIVNEVKIPEKHKICDTPMEAIETAREKNEGFHNTI